MRFVILFGPQAVGKMTIGQQLAACTGMKLFHNHMSIELVTALFEYASPSGQRLIELIRREVFEEASRSENGLSGLIFTYVWAFDLPSEREYIEGISCLFRERGAEICWVELEADVEERRRRNTTENRLLHKPSKRNIEWSDNELVESHQKYRLNSLPGEITEPYYMRLNTTQIEPDEAAAQIIAHFKMDK
ncbi:AAA family ATPase [Paenibacillus hunanensis]|uniref:AAA family ATPase n=1 Tax=Paenibacillus hunanensis TaxID=539262 RepID=UPI002026021A|nr:AAA family ATPase [Paenibacillus hunanensis]MCL9661869.1 AAA family ATPase [Paenibacillus hunanensis]